MSNDHGGPPPHDHITIFIADTCLHLAYNIDTKTRTRVSVSLPPCCVSTSPSLSQLFACLPACPSADPFIDLSIHLSIYESIYLRRTYLSINLPAYMSVFL